uniref:J domain-containing protein n=1 Tax=Globodera pallida TaxID=36090 RepID=A0A183C6F2_GLOPA
MGSSKTFLTGGLFKELRIKDFYQILDVSPTASHEEIKKAYYTLAKKYHPDVSGVNANATFAQKYMEIREAYDILCDEEKRNEHDRRLETLQFRRKRIIAARHKVYPFTSQKETGDETQKDRRIMPSLASLSNAFGAPHQWRRPFQNPTEDARREEKEAKIFRGLVVSFITLLIAYYVFLRFFARKRHSSGINLS